MTDQHPQYGELATPEEQRRAAGLPPLEGVAPVAAPLPPAPAGAAAQRDSAAGPSITRARPADRFVTIGLLAYGLINVVITGLSYLDLPTALNQTMQIMGVDGEFTNFAQGRLWGVIAAALLVVGWSLTAVFAIRRLRTGKLTWWVPLVGAVATIAAVSACIAVPMLNDPAFMAYLSKLSAG